jgi:exoribonuclease R
VFIPGLKCQNRSLDGDIVVVRLMEGKELEKEAGKVMVKRVEKTKKNKERQVKCERVKIKDDNTNDDNMDDDKGNGTKDIEENDKLEDNRIYGQVVYIIESLSYKKVHVGTISIERPGIIDRNKSDNNGNTPSTSDSRHVWFKPSDNRIPFILIPKETLEKEFFNNDIDFSTNLCQCLIRQWTDVSLFPLGIYAGKLGQIGTLPVESEALLINAGITWDMGFADDVLDSLPPTVILKLII